MDDPNDSKASKESNPLAALPDRSAKWISGISGGVAGAIGTALLVVVPIINTWLANVKEVSLAQVRNSAEQIAYISQRMADSDKERDLYKQEMILCQKELRELKK